MKDLCQPGCVSVSIYLKQQVEIEMTRIMSAIIIGIVKSN